MKIRGVYNKILTVALLVVGVLFFSSLSYSQSTGGTFSSGSLYNDTTIAGVDGESAFASDSLGGKKEVKERKPLESFLFSDSIKKQNVISWFTNPYNGTIEFTPIDTLLNNFQKDYIFFQDERAGVAYNGNLGGAAISQDFFNQTYGENFNFLDAYSSYLFTPENVPFYNGKKPFTQLSFFMSGQTARAEEQLRIIHAQNISPSSGFNMTYRNNSTRGMYANQASTDKNLSLAFNHTGKRYTLHAGYIFNNGKLGENGGVTDDGFVTDTIVDLPENIPVNLEDAYNHFVGHTVYATQSYGLPLVSLEEGETLRNVPALFFGNTTSYSVYRKIYTDSHENSVDGYYKNWYINPIMSQDSIRESVFDSRFFLQVQPYDREGVLSALDGGIGFKNESYYYFKPEGYIYNSANKNIKENSLYVYANGGGQLKKYMKWDGHFKYFPVGYRSQDMTVNGNIELSAFVKEKPITITAGVAYRMENASFWSEHYYSNHFKWENSFNKEIETRIEGAISMPAWGIEIGFDQSLIDGKVYYNQDALPTQFNDALSVTGLYLQKDFRIGGLNLKNRVLLQWSSSQEVAPVPLASANATYYYEFNVVKDVLRMQVGFDGYYNTSYYGFGYNPATMQFYNQRQVETGDYIWMDGFISGKWKRLRFLVKMQHLNYELFGGRDYFQVAHNPLNRRMFKLGVSWNFYD